MCVERRIVSSAPHCFSSRPISLPQKVVRTSRGWVTFLSTYPGVRTRSSVCSPMALVCLCWVCVCVLVCWLLVCCVLVRLFVCCVFYVVVPYVLCFCVLVC